jgi:hypothetical protein
MRQKLRVKAVDDGVRRDRLCSRTRKDTLSSIMGESVGVLRSLPTDKEKKRLINGVWVFNV